MLYGLLDNTQAHLVGVVLGVHQHLAAQHVDVQVVPALEEVPGGAGAGEVGCVNGEEFDRVGEAVCVHGV